MAQSDARPTGDQEVEGSIRLGSGNILSSNIYYGHSLPSADSRRTVVTFVLNNVHKFWLSAKKTNLVQEKVRQTELLDMTLIVLNESLNLNPTMLDRTEQKQDQNMRQDGEQITPQPRAKPNAKNEQYQNHCLERYGQP